MKHKEEAKADMEMEEDQEPQFLLVAHVQNILHSVFSNVEVYINNQQIHNSNGLFVHKSYNSNNFKGTTSEYEVVLHCEGYDNEDFPD